MYFIGDMCPHGQFSAFGGATICSFCYNGVSVNGTSCTLCPPGTYFQPGGACHLCPPGQFNPVDGALSCSDCSSVNGYTFKSGEMACHSCASFFGTQCSQSIATLLPNTWAFVNNSMLVATALCPSGFCLGGALSFGGNCS